MSSKEGSGWVFLSFFKGPFSRIFFIFMNLKVDMEFGTELPGLQQTHAVRRHLLVVYAITLFPLFSLFGAGWCMD